MSAKIYPWNKWFSKTRFTVCRKKTTIIQGETRVERGDYDCMPHSMAQQIRTAASRYGKRVSIKFDEDRLTVTVEEARAKGRKSKSK